MTCTNKNLQKCLFVFFISIALIVILGAGTVYIYTNNFSNQNINEFSSETLSEWDTFIGQYEEFEHPSEWEIKTSPTTIRAYDKQNNLVLNTYVAKADPSLERSQALEEIKNQIQKDLNSNPSFEEWDADGLNSKSKPTVLKISFKEDFLFENRYFITSFLRTPYVINISGNVGDTAASRIIDSFILKR